MALTQVQPGMLASDSQYTGFKSRIINGAMVFDQRNAGASVTATGSNYSLDRWQMLASASSKFTVQQSLTVPAGFTKSLLVTSSATTSLGATDYYLITQKIEGFNTADLGWGAAGASSVTVSFWVRSSLTGTFGFVVTSLSSYACVVVPPTLDNDEVTMLPTQEHPLLLAPRHHGLQ